MKRYIVLFLILLTFGSNIKAFGKDLRIARDYFEYCKEHMYDYGHNKCLTILEEVTEKNKNHIPKAIGKSYGEISATVMDHMRAYYSTLTNYSRQYQTTEELIAHILKSYYK